MLPRSSCSSSTTRARSAVSTGPALPRRPAGLTHLHDRERSLEDGHIARRLDVQVDHLLSMRRFVWVRLAHLHKHWRLGAVEVVLPKGLDHPTHHHLAALTFRHWARIHNSAKSQAVCPYPT
jgi:hypothetical protein